METLLVMSLIAIFGCSRATVPSSSSSNIYVPVQVIQDQESVVVTDEQQKEIDEVESGVDESEDKYVPSLALSFKG